MKRPTPQSAQVKLKNVDNFGHSKFPDLNVGEDGNIVLVPFNFLKFVRDINGVELCFVCGTCQIICQ